MRALLVAILLLTLSPPAFAETLTSRTQISDGDTLVVDGIKVRIHGIDTPESKQQCQRADGACYACGSEATAHMVELVGSAPVSCSLTGKRSYDRMIGVCSVDGQDLAILMLESGWAVASRKFLGEVPGKREPYLAAEAKAKQAKSGLWQGTFTIPWKWRRGDRSTGC